MAGGRPEIVKGSDRTLNLTARIPVILDPFPLTPVTEITALFKKSDGTWLTKTMSGGAITITNASHGKYAVSLDDSDTLELEAGIKASFKVYLDVGDHPGGQRKIVRYDQAIDIFDCD